MTTIATLRRPRRLAAVLAVVTAGLAVTVLGGSAAQAEAGVSRGDSIVDIVDFPVPIGDCINGGAGETLILNGALHSFTSLRADAAGGFHVTVHTNLVGASAVGATTGEQYRLTDTAGGFGDRLNLYFPANSGPRTYTESGDVRIISEGSAANLLVRATWQETVDANGNVTASAVRLEHLCVG
jgi:hypothetical protein